MDAPEDFCSVIDHIVDGPETQREPVAAFAYRRFERGSDAEGRMAAIMAALAGLTGKAEPRMTESPRYRVAREVTAGPQRVDS
ncbi:hypothetical protein [Actinomadura macrotermitis]|uniref:Uncharacterized protein n=1 Tax=Actinomadura macrotermitis TaxID=2585200 RepID=A0A7K0C4K7_9ACTN|nr:hypothetical protein [Actinomadura macrotermitis]MQY08381.1 hypothetical protein [Actinomadura macrotermitis]